MDDGDAGLGCITVDSNGEVIKSAWLGLVCLSGLAENYIGAVLEGESQSTKVIRTIDKILKGDKVTLSHHVSMSVNVSANILSTLDLLKVMLLPKDLMEDLQKGASKKDLKKNPPPDDDFGKDFFNSWESAKFGNDSFDFGMETVPKNKMASFKFDELDNFELSGNFDKLSSFKLDVPNLDFSELSNKNEETRGKCLKECATGKKESKEDKFSFDFDLNSFQIKPSNHQTLIGVKSTAGSSFQKLSNEATIDHKVSSDSCNTTSVKEISKPKLDSSRRLGSQIININKDASLGGKSNCDILNSTIAKTLEVNNNNTYSKPRETKSVHFLEKKMAYLLNAVNPANLEKHVSLHSPLKRKIDEESSATMETSSPFKLVKDSTPIKRSSFEASENTKRKMVLEFKSTETCKSAEACKDVTTPVANLTSLTSTSEIHNVVAGVPSVLEDEDKLLKTETFMKDLDRICCMVRKQQEKVKDLHVHSIINNSELLLLNYSMLGENIQELQKFTSCLLRGS